MNNLPTPDAPDIASLQVGDRASLSRTVSEADVLRYAEITGDYNPIHVDEDYAARSAFGGRIAHGMLAAGHIGAVMAMKLPGPGAIYQEQSLAFLAPIRIGDTITASVEIVELGPKRKSARLKTTCVNQHGTVVVEGMAAVLLPRKRRSKDSTAG